MTWIGIDDTDGPSGGCTTFVLTEVLGTASELGLDLIGPPRLVRLNPNIPYKTRGNAALSARFGHGVGGPRRIGVRGGRPLFVWGRGRPLRRNEDDRLFDAVWETVRRTSRLGEPGTDPALVMARRPLPAALYWSAVQRVVDPSEAVRLMDATGARRIHAGSPQGLVGAAAAIAWRGGHPTWELVAYREAGHRARTRRIERASAERAERRFPELFLSTDRRTRRLLIAPHTPCPILLGLRATRPERLPQALAMLRTEPIERWVIFQTNQGTGDHLVARDDPPGPYESAVLGGTIEAPPVTGRGGHVRLDLRLPRGEVVSCLAFEPTKVLPRIAAQLRPGDRVRVWGGRGEDPTLRLEGIEVRSTAPALRPAGPPPCPACGHPTESVGAARGYRCPVDGRRLPPEARAAVALPRGRLIGRYHPTPSARRHLNPRASEGDRGGDTDVPWWRRRPLIDL